jgi:hypothetical protein
MVRAQGTVELNVRLVAGSNPLRGSMQLTGGETREFWGWLELAELIQQASDGGSDEGRAELRSVG